MLQSTYNASSMLRSDYGPLERIGGTESNVFRGRGNDGRFVALRFISCDVAPVRSALINLVQTASLIRHPMLAAVGGCQSYSGGLCIVSEFVPGIPLDHWIAQHGLPSLRMTVDLVRRLCLGLHALHQRSLAHGVVHPGNIMVLSPDTRPGGRIVAKLLDVGVPAWLRTWPPSSASVRYLAPELVRVTSEEVAPASACADVFACGGLLHYLCTGEPPIPVPSSTQLIAAPQSTPLPRPSEINPEISPELEYVMLRALSLEPSQRLANTGDLAIALGHVEAQWDGADVERVMPSDAHRAHRHTTSPDALTPVVNPRGMRAANMNGSSSQPSVIGRVFPSALPRGVAQTSPPQPSPLPEPEIEPESRVASVVQSAAPRSQHVRARAAIATSGHYPKIDWPAKQRPSPYVVASIGLGAAAVFCLAYFASRPDETTAAAATVAHTPSRPGAIMPAAPVPQRVRIDNDRAELSNAGAPKVPAETQVAELSRDEREFVRTQRIRPRRAREADHTREDVTKPAEVEPSQPSAAPVLTLEPLDAARKPHDKPQQIEPPAPKQDAAPPPQHAALTAEAPAAPPPVAAVPAALEEHAPVEAVPAKVAAAAPREELAPQAKPARAARHMAIEDVSVRGSLSASVVRRAIERIRPQLQRCVREHTGEAAQREPVRVTATIDEIGRASEPSVSGAAPALRECVLSATSKLVADRPDTGTVKVSWTLQ